uniref:Uncharacterized protein n=1 Tax=Coccolithus braarudii TaxID=221442 RepID=A0A7S0LMS9_9EUKA
MQPQLPQGFMPGFKNAGGVPTMDAFEMAKGGSSEAGLAKSLGFAGGPKFGQDATLWKNSAGVDDGAAEVDAKPPMAIGGYLEPSYHVFSNWKPLDIMHGIETALQQFGPGKKAMFVVDFGADLLKYKFSCTAYARNGQATVFVVCVFSVEDTESYAIEFQKRSGDAFDFRKIYVKCINSFKNMVDEAASSLPTPVFQPPMLDFPDEEQPTAEQLQMSVKPLQGMLESGYMDVMRQGVMGIVHQSLDKRLTKYLADEGCLKALLKGSQSRMEDVHRCCLTALANIAESCSEDALVRMVKLGVVRLAANHALSANKHVQRESARLLAGCCRCDSKLCGDAEVDELCQKLEQLQTHPNAMIQKHGREIVGKLRKA